MKYVVWFQYDDGRWDDFSNNGKGFTYKEALEVNQQLREQNYKTCVAELEGSEFDA